MSEVDEKTQAELELKLSDNVRDLVRKHVLEAFNDPFFVDHLVIDFLHRKLEKRSYGGIDFTQAVRNVIRNQMNKY